MLSFLAFPLQKITKPVRRLKIDNYGYILINQRKSAGQCNFNYLNYSYVPMKINWYIQGIFEEFSRKNLVFWKLTNKAIKPETRNCFEAIVSSEFRKVSNFKLIHKFQFYQIKFFKV